MGRGISRWKLLIQSASGVAVSVVPLIVFGLGRSSALQSPRDVSQLDGFAVRKFASRLRGQALLPGDRGYESACQNWAGQMSLRPGLVVRCTATEDVVATVRFARDHDLPIAVRSGGHKLRSTDGGVLVNLSGMKRVSVDAALRTARADAGREFYLSPPNFNCLNV